MLKRNWVLSFYPNPSQHILRYTVPSHIQTTHRSHRQGLSLALCRSPPSSVLLPRLACAAEMAVARFWLMLGMHLVNPIEIWWHKNDIWIFLSDFSSENDERPSPFSSVVQLQGGSVAQDWDNIGTICSVRFCKRKRRTTAGTGRRHSEDLEDAEAWFRRMEDINQLWSLVVLVAWVKGENWFGWVMVPYTFFIHFSHAYAGIDLVEAIPWLQESKEEADSVVYNSMINACLILRHFGCDCWPADFCEEFISGPRYSK